MKRVNNIYNNITEMSNIINIYKRQVRVNTKNKQKIENFENMLVQNMVIVKDLLDNKKYVCGRYNIFMISEPKIRVIMSQNIRDKLINHLVAKYFLLDVLDKCLLPCNVATRPNKGTHFGIKLTKKYLNEIKKDYDCFYVLKFDISKYFYSIDHEIVKKLLKTKIKDKDALNILFNIIDSTDEDYVNETINKLKNNYISKINKMNILNKKERVEEIKKIPLYEKGKGLPIGNVSSQILAVFYLNELDYFIKERLKIKYYVRYMDDGIIIHQDKDYLKFCLKEIEKIINKYKLSLNSKTSIINIKNGFCFLGFNFYIKNKKLIMKVKNSTKKKFKRKMKSLYKLEKRNKIEYKDIKQVLASYEGHLSYGNCYNLVKRNIKNIDDIGRFVKIQG